MKKKKHSKKTKANGSTKKKIKKSDSIIVVAKKPIDEIIEQTAVAKEIKEAVKEISKKKKSRTLDKKIKEIKPAKQPSVKEFYQSIGQASQSPYNPKNFYTPSYNVKDNAELFMWEYNETVAKTQAIIEHDKLGSRPIMPEKDLMQYLSNFMLNKHIGQDMNDIPIEQKEKMNYYAMFNRPWIMMKVSLLGLGEKRYHANRPHPIKVLKRKEVK